MGRSGVIRRNGFGSTDKINKDGSMTGEYRLGNHRGNE